VDIPQTRYAKTTDGVHIAYQILGDGPVDLVLVGAGYSTIEFGWQLPPIARFLRRLASFARVIQFDPRGFGVSDPLTAERLPTLETRMADTLAVMEAVGSERAALYGGDSTGPLAILFAATYPDRTTALILYATTACGLVKPEYPWSWTEEQWETYAHQVEEGWGDPAYVEGYLRQIAPTFVLDDAALQAWTTFFRLAASPGAVAAQDRMERDTDVRHVLATVQVPTLVMHRSGDQFYSVEEGRYLAEHIPGARFVELEGVDHVPWVGDSENLVAEVERFLASVRNEEARSIACSPRCSSRISSVRRRRPPRSGTSRGASSWIDTMRPCAPYSPATVAARWTPPATGSSQLSMGQPGRSGAPRPSSMRSSRWGSKFEPGCTPVRSR
jgi:pimeloyl-ACP methyl ester carboxylesterase